MHSRDGMSYFIFINVHNIRTTVFGYCFCKRWLKALLLRKLFWRYSLYLPFPMLRSTAKGNICKPFLKLHVFIILIVLFNMHEVILIWSQIFTSSYQMSSYTLDDLFMYIFFNGDRIILFHKVLSTFRNKLKNSSLESWYARTVLWFSHIPVRQRFTDCCFRASMDHLNPPFVKRLRVLPVWLICNSAL